MCRFDLSALREVFVKHDLRRTDSIQVDEVEDVLLLLGTLCRIYRAIKN